jgi:hypothetical protein
VPAYTPFVKELRERARRIIVLLDRVHRVTQESRGGLSVPVISRPSPLSSKIAKLRAQGLGWKKISRS